MSTLEQEREQAGQPLPTRYLPHVTHVTYEGEMHAVNELRAKFGFTYEQLLARREMENLRTFCKIGEQALTLDQFEQEHPHIELGTN